MGRERRRCVTDAGESVALHGRIKLCCYKLIMHNHNHMMVPLVTCHSPAATMISITHTIFTNFMALLV